MNLRDLRYLVALADHRHFSHAAAASFVSQPTLSTQIKKLEDELGVSLVERSPRRVMLTEVGRAVAERARYVLREVAEIREIARRTQDPESGSVRVGFFPTLGPYLLPHVVARIRARFPRLELLLVEEKTPLLVQMLIEGKLDAAGLALPLHDDRLHAEYLFEEPFVLAVPRCHELAGRSALAVDDLADRSLLLLEDGHCLREQALDVCHRAGSTERSGFRATSLETLRQMVAAEVGITLLPALAVKPPVPVSENIALVPFSGRVPSRRIALAWRRTTAMAPFLSRLAAVIADLPAELLTASSAKNKPSAVRRSRRAAVR